MADLDIVDAIYGAGFGEHSWDYVTDLMLRDLGVCWSNVMTWTPETGALMPFASASSDVEWTSGMLDDYAKEYWQHDPALPFLPRWSEGVWLTEFDTLPRDKRARNPFLQEFVRGNGMGCIRALRIPHPSTQRFFFSFFAEKGQPPLDDEQQRRVTAWARHLSRSVQAMGLMNSANQSVVTPQGLDHSPTPTWVVRDDGVVLETNLAARALLERGDAPVRHFRRKLIVGSVGTADNWARLCLGGSLTLGGVDGFFRLQAFRVPHPTELAQQLGSQVYLVCVTRLPQPTKGPRERLTAKELEVLHFVAKGLSYEEVSGLMGISFHTVSTHVRSIFSKLNCRSKAEAIFEAHQLGLIN